VVCTVRLLRSGRRGLTGIARAGVLLNCCLFSAKTLRLTHDIDITQMCGAAASRPKGPQSRR